MVKKSWSLAVWLVIPILLVGREAGSLEFSKNGYTGLVVAIADSVPENLDMIEQIKAMFTNASSYLYTATRQRAYFRSVTILVPKNWTRQDTWNTSIDESFETADVRVDRPNPLYGDSPYTFQPGQCGEPGRYIHLVPQFVADANWRATTFGEGGRLLVHEFAHLRFGVFDEYGFGDSRYPFFYRNDVNQIKATACTSNVTGKYLSRIYQKACILDNSTRLPTSDCAFFPDINSNSVRASIMFQQAVNSIDQFCDNTSDVKMKHNEVAPNQQNAMCNKRATWEIIASHGDFRNGNSPSTVRETTPVFTVVQPPTVTLIPCGRRGVLVMDVSGSMATNNRILRQQQTAAAIITALPLGSRLALVKFSGTATVLHDFQNINNDSDRTSLIGALPSVTEGSTAIGLGLLKAIEILNADGGVTKEDHIFLTTDGEQNVAPPVNEILNSLVATGVHVHTLAYSKAASSTLSSVSTQTDGLYFYFDESLDSTKLDSAASQIVQKLTKCMSDVQVDVDRVAFSATGTGILFERDVLVDNSIGRNLTFTFILSKNIPVQVVVTSPSGKDYNSSSPEYTFDSNLLIISVKIPQAEPGQWRYTIFSVTAVSGTAVSNVRAQAEVGNTPIEITAWMGSLFADPTTGNNAIVYTYAHQSYSPLLYANVKASVSRLNLSSVDIELKDDGIKPDNRANDGVYSAYFTEYSGNSRHSVDVIVSSTDQTGLLKLGDFATGAFPIVPVPPVAKVLEPVENVTRTSTAGAFDVKGVIPGVDQIPPADVTDLRVVSIDKVNRLVTLTWTAPGDDLRTGKVSKNDLRIGGSYDQLNYNFSSCIMVTPDLIINGSLEPIEADLEQSITVNLNATIAWANDTFVFGLIATDDAGRSSSLSNLAVATFDPVTYPQNTGPAVVDPDQLSSNGDQQENFTALIVGIVCGFIGATVIVTAVALLAAKCSTKKRKASELNSVNYPRDSPVTNTV